MCQTRIVDDKVVGSFKRASIVSRNAICRRWYRPAQNCLLIAPQKPAKRSNRCCSKRTRRSCGWSRPIANAEKQESNRESVLSGGHVLIASRSDRDSSASMHAPACRRIINKAMLARNLTRCREFQRIAPLINQTLIGRQIALRS